MYRLRHEPAEPIYAVSIDPKSWRDAEDVAPNSDLSLQRVGQCSAVSGQQKHSMYVIGSPLTVAWVAFELALGKDLACNETYWQ